MCPMPSRNTELAESDLLNRDPKETINIAARYFKSCGPFITSSPVMNEQGKDEPPPNEFTRRNLLEAAAPTAIAAAALAGLNARAQSRENVQKAEHDHSVSDPGPENKVLLDLNPNSNLPPPTD